MQYYGVDWLAKVCGLAGVYLLGNKNKIGFLVFMVASLSWVTFGILTGSVAMISAAQFSFLCTCAVG